MTSFEGETPTGESVDVIGDAADTLIKGYVQARALREADLFVLPSKRGEDGDRDGLPNVVMEAASQALPIVATDFAGIPEFVRDGVEGLLVPPGDVAALAQALAELAAAMRTLPQVLINVPVADKDTVAATDDVQAAVQVIGPEELRAYAGTSVTG